MSFLKKPNLRTLAALSMLTALQVVLSRFLSIQTPVCKIGLGFIPVMFAGALFGPLGGGLVGGLSDVLGAILFPSGSYFPGYTLTAILAGVIYGLFFGKSHNYLRILIAYLLTTVLNTLLLNSFFIAFQNAYLLAEAAGRQFSDVWVMFASVLPTRLVQAAVMYAVQVVVTYLLLEQLHLDARVKRI